MLWWRIHSLLGHFLHTLLRNLHSTKTHLWLQLQKETLGHFEFVPSNRDKVLNAIIFNLLSANKAQVLHKHISFSNIPLTFTAKNSKTSKMSNDYHHCLYGKLVKICIITGHYKSTGTTNIITSFNCKCHSYTYFCLKLNT